MNYAPFSAIMIEQSVPIDHFESLTSTNQTAWELWQQGKVPPFAVTADIQTAGKGQWGRQWVSPVGGLYLSLLLTTETKLEEQQYLTISSVFGVSELLACYQIPIAIKWLNDLYLNRKKLGGFLLETRGHKETSIVVIGVGINWNNQVPNRGIGLAHYLEKIGIKPYLEIPSRFKNELSQVHLPEKLTSLADLKQIVLTGLQFGFNCYHQQGITEILPQYEARLL